MLPGIIIIGGIGTVVFVVLHILVEGIGRGWRRGGVFCVAEAHQNVFVRRGRPWRGKRRKKVVEFGF